MTDNATQVQMSHCWTSRLVVFSSASSGPSTVGQDERQHRDAIVAMMKVLSEKTSRG